MGGNASLLWARGRDKRTVTLPLHDKFPHRSIPGFSPSVSLSTVVFIQLPSTMQDQQNAIALDHISNVILTAPSKESYHATVAWFEHLGFKPIMTESSAEMTATWLQLFSSSASIHDVSLKIVLSASAFRRLANSSKMDWRSLPAIATITTSTFKVTTTRTRQSANSLFFFFFLVLLSLLDCPHFLLSLGSVRWCCFPTGGTASKQALFCVGKGRDDDDNNDDRCVDNEKQPWIRHKHTHTPIWNKHAS